MNPAARPDQPVLLPSSSAWSEDARLVGDTFALVGAAAATTFDDTRFLLPPLTWTIAAERVGDCVTTDHRPENLRVLLLPTYAADAVWACHTALVQAAEPDDDSEHLNALLTDYLTAVHDTNLRGLTEALERVLAVLTLDLPAARPLITHLVLKTEVSQEDRAALDDVLEAWREAGVAC
ncbi:hypothetical protein GCM10010329_85830 [Streptomyces spiroverticillatus]|uniref:Uncharacterized protein n=1 Tax=Streptomyces finlayi TaxID=67296 RepID=A0A918XA66_9ACTN|nr:hypothetical protein [Streptomyces finlayi]GHA50694.1 hypothetical protein GCM10010329_85830 [Streptomyces spiroverticillatus]GHD19969.1 hypothetical protein GCM10010334_84060 [Streptomyces finlayi]